MGQTAGQPIQDSRCFCCGESNPYGLKLRYRYPEEGEACTSFTIPDYFTGWQGIVHGGLLAMVLDETMAHACVSQGLYGFTGEISVRYRKAVSVGTTVHASGSVVATRRRVVTTVGQITVAGTKIAEAEATFMVSAGPLPTD